jgi:DNA-binding MarR family transcriptional regulator
MEPAQFPPSEVLKLDNQLCFALYALSRRVTALYRPLLEPLGITYPQYLVFLVMWEIQSGIAPGYFLGVPVKTLCQRLLLDTGTLTPLLKRMEQEGWLIRQRSRHDEREVLISLSQKGLDLRAEALKVPAAMMCQTGVPMAELMGVQQQLHGWLKRVGSESDALKP